MEERRPILHVPVATRFPYQPMDMRIHPGQPAFPTIQSVPHRHQGALSPIHQMEPKDDLSVRRQSIHSSDRSTPDNKNSPQRSPSAHSDGSCGSRTPPSGTDRHDLTPGDEHRDNTDSRLSPSTVSSRDRDLVREPRDSDPSDRDRDSERERDSERRGESPGVRVPQVPKPRLAFGVDALMSGTYSSSRERRTSAKSDFSDSDRSGHGDTKEDRLSPALSAQSSRSGEDEEEGRRSMTSPGDPRDRRLPYPALYPGDVRLPGFPPSLHPGAVPAAHQHSGGPLPPPGWPLQPHPSYPGWMSPSDNSPPSKYTFQSCVYSEISLNTTSIRDILKKLTFLQKLKSFN